MQHHSLGLASTAAVRQYLRLAESRQLNPTILLQQLGLPEQIWHEESGHLSGEEFQALLELLLTHYPSPILGLLSGDFVQPGSYSLLGYITMSCATLGEAIARIAPFEKLVGDMGTTSVYGQDNEVFIQWQCHYPSERVRPQMVDNVFSSWIGYARWLGGDLKADPLRIELQRSEPQAQYLPEYQSRWRCPVLFNQAHNRIVIDKAFLNLPLRQPNPPLRQALELQAQSQLAELQPHNVLLQKVSDALQMCLLEGQVNVDLVAAKLHMSPRTLQRRLQQQGVPYQDLLAQARLQQAQWRLSQTQQSVEDIAYGLGFSEPTSFYRSFKQWTGLSPKRWRLAKRAKNLD